MKEKLPAIIQSTYDDIVAIKVQGATNVALATFIAIGEWAKKSEITTVKEFKTKLNEYLAILSGARPNEPLTKNGARYIVTQLTLQHPDLKTVQAAANAVVKLAHDYIKLLEDAKKKIVAYGVKEASFADVIFTHCHSSTAEAIITKINKHHKITVVNTETRPLFQGRITSRNLLKAGVKDIMIVDAAATSFIADDSFLPVNAVFLGADQVSVHGDAMNKVGSFSIGLAAYFSSKPLYIVTPSLKMDITSVYHLQKPELREKSEVWPDAPKGLQIINPAFDVVPHQFITGYITEFGVIKPEDLENTVRRNYEWIS